MVGIFDRFLGRGKDIRCAVCGKTWKVPAKIDKEPRIIVSVPRPDLPSGQCPTCNSVYCQGCATLGKGGFFYMCPKCNKQLILTDEISSILSKHTQPYMPK